MPFLPPGVNLLDLFPYTIEKLDGSLEALGSNLSYTGFKKALESLQL
jgi:hypothetical protein